MTNAVKNIAKTIVGVAMNEDIELYRLVGEGIFFMPEIAFAYACGKAIMLDSREIFGNIGIPKWVREKKLNNGGLTDLVFEYKDEWRIAIEFKMRATADAYIADLDKLSNLDSQNPPTAKLFCGLIDIFPDQRPTDGRLIAMEQYNQTALISLIEPKRTFSTVQDWYTKNEVSCVVGVWAVGDLPPILSEA